MKSIINSLNNNNNINEFKKIIENIDENTLFTLLKNFDSVLSQYDIAFFELLVKKIDFSIKNEQEHSVYNHVVI